MIGASKSRALALVAILLLPCLARGETEGTVVKIEVVRAGPSGFASSIGWKVEPTGDHPADGADFVGGQLPSGTLEFAVGEKSRFIEIHVRQDTDVEPDETFNVVLSNPKSGSIINSKRLVTIVNDDEDRSTPLTLSLTADKLSAVDVWTLCTGSLVNSNGTTTPSTCTTSNAIKDGGGQILNNDVAIDEGGQNEKRRLYLTVTAARAALTPYTVEYRVVGTGSHPADANDFGGALPAGTVTMNSPVQTFSIDVTGDDTPEYTEGFEVDLYNPTGGAVLGNATVKGSIKGELIDTHVATASISPSAQGTAVQTQTTTPNVTSVVATAAGGTTSGNTAPLALTVQHREIKLFRVIALNGGTDPFDFVNLKTSIVNAGKPPPTTSDNAAEPPPTVNAGEPPPTVNAGLPLTTSLPLVDDNGDDSQIILVNIDTSDNLSAIQASPSTDTGDTALQLIGNQDVVFPGTAYVFDTTAFTLISPANGSTLQENVTNNIIVQRGGGNVYKIVLQFVQTGFQPGDMKLTSLSAFDCGTSQSGCP